MKLIILGGRNYKLTRDDFLALNDLASEHNVTEIVSSGVTSAVAGGEEWASSQSPPVPIKVFRVDWNKYGKAAGSIRNREMLEYVVPDGGILLFPGGTRTASMIQEAIKYNLSIFDWRDTQD